MKKNGKYIDPIIYTPWEMVRSIVAFPPHPFHLIKQIYTDIKASNILTKRSIQFNRTLKKFKKKGINSIKKPQRFKELCKTYPAWAKEFSKLMYSCPDKQSHINFCKTFGITKEDLHHHFGNSVAECEKIQAFKDPRRTKKFARMVAKNLKNGNNSVLSQYNISTADRAKMDINVGRLQQKHVNKTNRQISRQNFKNKIIDSCKNVANAVKNSATQARNNSKGAR